ncbi:MAG: GatB/YqeY domain-containing protein [Planctomycetes bacterium]|nr:GatB/YqeY domain-containing protein [Planctomycetota bacterium]
MTLRERLEADVKTAMKAHDELAVSTLRMARSEISKRDLEGKGPIDEAGVQKALGALIKQRADSAAEFRKGNRPELAAKEEKEAAILKTYLPAEVPDAAVEEAVAAAIAQTGAKSAADLGRAMGAAMKLLKEKGGTVDGNRVRHLLSKRLV